MNRNSWFVAASLAAMLTIAGCHKKTPAPPPPPAPPASAPTPVAEINANPDSINPGDASVLTWKTTDANTVSIVGMGAVATSGTTTVHPTQTTTYHLIAQGDGGSADATATVTVNAGGPPPANNVGESNIDENAFEAAVKPVFYDYDSYDVRPDAQSTIQADANYLNQHPELKVVVGGYCDERGSTEYNLALGENRANAAKQALVSAGVSPGRLRTVSYGKEKQFCTDHTEACWQQNRRAQFTLDQ
ncbi:MAG TPA: peptidoglycan-associated lipoprotein Pal [Acidobacteriaceae bacterium]|jgi:peptidoglycan-associated lipoprotein|nr:peptidoglycan-associated lipoprotein Pal [Acidobacteriaceae bacterium]